MARIKKAEPIVLDILRDNPAARNDDFILIFKVLKAYTEGMPITIDMIMNNHQELDLPSFETITRCRRKLQEKYPELASERTKQLRAEEETEFKQYALEL